ncbi:MAG: Fe-S-containing hydro-lyase [Oscillospiraceae bacterium]|nr:Fe-S-containing hydro-lyase [Oscillospiraceae bacterium]
MEAKRVSAPLSREAAARLRCGDAVLLSGTVYTARDAAHRRFLDCLRRGEPLPFPVENAVLFYVGPSPAPPGHVVGSAGPTTSYRMDAETPALLRLGLRGMIGKGRRSPEVIAAMREAGAVYFGAIGGAGALLSACVRSAELICYPDLGAEAVRRLEVENMPLTVVIDAAGNDLYELGRSAYLAQRAEANGN